MGRTATGARGGRSPFGVVRRVRPTGPGRTGWGEEPPRASHSPSAPATGQTAHFEPFRLDDNGVCEFEMRDLRAHGFSGLSQQDREDEPDDQGHAATISVGTTKAPSP